MAAADADPVRLPAHSFPLRYDIKLEPDLEKCTFAGSVTVQLQIVATTTSLTCHIHQIDLSEQDVTYQPAGGDAIKAASQSRNDADQKVTFDFGVQLPLGHGTLTIGRFTGVLNDELAGFYRSKYTVRGQPRNMAVTQFEATDARRCFPCWDEPALKAVFGITVMAPAGQSVISNMHATRVETSADGAKKTWTFADTPKQSTYLVAIIVGEFDVISAVGRSGLVTSVYIPVGKPPSLGEFALRTGVASIELLEDLFKVPYMGSKVDHLAIPDFAAGAMENTGAITYREAALLLDEAQSSFGTRQRVAQVVAHELSHQWFGNRTTMQWWDSLWLNEGFAKHMEYVVTNALFPSWRTFDHFTALVQSAAFSLDSMASTHPIEVPVKHPDEINEIFDAISYNKGASVIRMLFDWIGHEVGFKGLNLYLTRHAYGNAVTTQLWDALAEASGEPVKATMANWTACPGFPYLYISEETERGAEPSAAADTPIVNESLELDSHRCIAPWAANNASWPGDNDFKQGPAPSAFHEANRAWKAPLGPGETDDWCIPISIVEGGGRMNGGRPTTGKLGLLLLPVEEGSTLTREARLTAMATNIADAAATSGARYIKLNANHASFYRTLYSPSMLRRLLPAVATSPDGITPPALGVADRLGLVGDVSAGVAIGMTSSTDLLRLLWALRHERDYNVWSVMIEAVTSLQSSAEAVSQQLHDTVTSFMRALLQPVVAWVGWEAREGEDPNTPLLRALVLRMAAMAGQREVVAECLRRFDVYASAALASEGGAGPVNVSVAIAPDLRQTVYNTAAAEKEGCEARWKQLHALFIAAKLSEEQRRLMTALGRAAEPALLQRALDMVMSGEVRSQDAVFLVAAVGSNPGPTGRNLTWGWLKGGWDSIHPKMAATNFLWGGVVGGAIGGFSDRAAYEDIDAWFRSHPAGSAERKVKQSLEAIRGRVWRAHILKGEQDAVTQTFNQLLQTA